MNHSAIDACVLLWPPWQTKTARKVWKIGTSIITSSLASTCRNSQFVTTSSLKKTAFTVVTRSCSVTGLISASEAATSCADEQLQFPKDLLCSFSSNSPFLYSITSIHITNQSITLDEGFWGTSPSNCLGVTIMVSWVVIASKVVFRLDYNFRSKLL